MQLGEKYFILSAAGVKNIFLIGVNQLVILGVRLKTLQTYGDLLNLTLERI